MNNLVAMPVISGHLKAALQYAALGWHIFPCWPVKDGKCACGVACKSPGKHPVHQLAPHGQKNATTDIEIIRNWWTQMPDANIAVYLEQSGLCAVDIDPRNGGDFTIDELEHRHGKIEAEVVQLTGGGGEHRIFQCPSGNLPGTLGKGVDLKLNGYIIVEPSNHISGGNYQWEASSNPLDNAIASPLPDWIRSLTAQPVHLSDVHSVANPIVDELQVQDLQAALPFIDSDDRDIWLKVGMALHGTNDSRAYGWWSLWSQSSKKYNDRDQYRVWRSFRFKGLGGLGLPTIFGMAQDSGWINTGRVGALVELPVIVTDQPANQAIDTGIPVSDQVPQHLLHVPVDMLEALAHWMEGFSREPQRQITVQGTLALASVLCSRIYCSTEANTSSLYLMTLAGTGVGKNYVKTAIQQFLTETGQASLLSGAGNTSAGAVFSALFDSPSHIQITDEIGKHLQTASKQSNGQMKEAFTTLTEAYSSTTGMLIPKNYSIIHLTGEQRKQQPKKIVHWPAISVLGMATPGQVYENLSIREIEDGFLNRFIVVEACLPQSTKRPTNRIPVMDWMKQWVDGLRNPDLSGKSLQGLDTAYDQQPIPIDVTFATGVLDLFDEYQNQLKAREKAGEFILPDLTRRYTENAMRLATLLAVSDTPKQPVITRKLAQWALDYVSFYGQAFMDAVSTKVADTEFHRLYLAVKTLIERAGVQGLTERELSQRSRTFAATAPHLRTQALEALIREDLIKQVSTKSLSGRGKPRIAYISMEHFSDENSD